MFSDGLTAPVPPTAIYPEPPMEVFPVTMTSTGPKILRMPEPPTDREEQV